MFETTVYTQRRAELLERIPEGGIVLLPANEPSPINYPSNTYRFRQDSTFLYFFGLRTPSLIGFLDLDSKQEIIFGDDYSLTDIIWMGEQESIQCQALRVGVKLTQPLKELENYITKALKSSRRVHFLPAYNAQTQIKLANLSGININKITENYSVELALAVVSLREKKSQLEIDQIESASKIAYAMQCAAMRISRPGVRERDIALAIENIALQQGQGLSFSSIVTHNGQILHNTSYDNHLQDGRLLLVDCGGDSDEFYASDLTRSVPVNGKFTSKQKDIYNIVYRASALAFTLSQPDVLYQDIHLKVALQISEDLKSLGLMKGSPEDAVQNGAYSLFMPHGLGHMMGLDVHDMENIGENYVGYDKFTHRSEALGVSSLRMGRRLKEGFVMTVEPGIYFIPDYIASWKKEKTNISFINFSKLENYLDFGGIRLEDDMLITKSSNRMIGEHRAPASVEEIENFMKN